MLIGYVTMGNGEDYDLSKVGVIVLGSPGSLRNPSLESIHPNVRFSPPVYLAVDIKPRISQLFREFLLNGRFLSLGERGCSQAHINLRKEILVSPLSWTLVLEDDVGIPLDWFRRVCEVLPRFPDDAAPGVILLNTNPHFNLGPGVVKLNLLPSGANAFLIHRDALDNRRFAELESLERADWPTSFSSVDFWTISDLAFELPTESRVGPRKTRRVSFLFSTFVRALFSPMLARVLGLPLGTYLSWSVVGPMKRDLTLKVKAWMRVEVQG
jgi:hypothetical protein